VVLAVETKKEVKNIWLFSKKALSLQLNH